MHCAESCIKEHACNKLCRYLATAFQCITDQPAGDTCLSTSGIMDYVLLFAQFTQCTNLFPLLRTIVNVSVSALSNSQCAPYYQSAVMTNAVSAITAFLLTSTGTGKAAYHNWNSNYNQLLGGLHVTGACQSYTSVYNADNNANSINTLNQLGCDAEAVSNCLFSGM